MAQALTELRAELFRYRVLDPACGSGNFLYVAFRELYRLDTELLSRMREFPSTAGKLSWNGGIPATNFYGIDINPFAVELAKVTLNIAKKIAFEERREAAYALAGQVELDLDPSLPLDNLDENIVCMDALFCDWPETDAIVGNPPMLGDKKMRTELGAAYAERLKEMTGGALVEYSCYWFRLTHDRLPLQGRAGLVATSGIRVGKAKAAAMDYIVENGGTITAAVSSRLWPGDAAVNVSMVNWTKGPAQGPFLLVVDDQSHLVSQIPPHLQLFADLGGAHAIAANERGTSVGVMFGHSAFRSGEGSFAQGALPGRFVRPVATANDLLRGRLDAQCIWMVECASDEEARLLGRDAYSHLKEHVLPMIAARANSDERTDHYRHWLRSWWKPQMPRLTFFAEVADKSRLIVCPRNAGRSTFLFLSSKFIPTDTLYVFAYDDDYSFGVVQSSSHWHWAVGKGARVREDITYTGDVWRTFPWPQAPTDVQVAAVADAGRALRKVRTELMTQNGWSLRTLHQAAAVEGPHPLKDAQARLDEAVDNAHGVPHGQDRVTFLLELNQLVAEDEAAGRKVRGPGLPDHLDPKDPRWFSTDCIEPPPLAE